MENFSIFQIFQGLNGLGLGTILFVILRLVYVGKISDKYGVGWLTLLASLMIVNFSFNWFTLASIPSGILALVCGFGFMALVVSFSIQLTEYSRARRKAIQELALLRYRYQKLSEKIKTSDLDPIVQTH